MKQTLCILLAVLLCGLAGGCGTQAAPSAGNDSLATGQADAERSAVPTDAPGKKAKPAAIPDFVDLATMSDTLVYAELYNITTSPKNYEGKTIRIRGIYQANYYEETQQTYHAVLVADVAACCQQGLEFVYPGSYPQEGARIEVTGRFKSYQELGQTYYHLLADEVAVVG